MGLAGNLKNKAGLAGLALGVVCLGPALWAQTSGQPARAVRLSYVDGQVRLTQGTQVLAGQAVVNTPLFEGMQVTTADDGKAEIQFEDSSVVRISPDSSLTLSVLRGLGSSATADLVLNGGLAYFELQGSGQAGQINVRFGDALATTSGFTVLRVSLDQPPGQLAVFSGNAHLDEGNGAVSVDLHGGESIALNAVAANYSVAESIEPDSWDEWNSDRDQALTTEAANQTATASNLGVSQTPAWSDLDANGNWYNVPGQGYVWSPYDASNAGFDPFGFGNWMWTPGFGYIWVSGYPWGYLPFQCGAWNFYDGFGWGWAPGMGGCMPWWGMGFYGGLNLGFFPAWYRPITRPILPRRPVGGRPVPMVAVTHGTPYVGPALPARNRNTPATIAGNSVLAVHPLQTQPAYVHTIVTAGPSNRTTTVQTNGQVNTPRNGYVPNQQGGVNTIQGTFGPNNTQPTNHSVSNPPSNRGNSSPTPQSHSSGGSSGSSHSGSSSSGGGGGGSHTSSGGGGGGGGGGGHSSGGGGGGGGGHK